MTRGRGRPRSCPDEVLARVVALRSNGALHKEICTVMNGDGVPTPGGGRVWWPSHVTRLLRTRDAVALLAAARLDHPPADTAG